MVNNWLCVSSAPVVLDIHNKVTESVMFGHIVHTWSAAEGAALSQTGSLGSQDRNIAGTKSHPDTMKVNF